MVNWISLFPMRNSSGEFGTIGVQLDAVVELDIDATQSRCFPSLESVESGQDENVKTGIAAHWIAYATDHLDHCTLWMKMSPTR